MSNLRIEQVGGGLVVRIAGPVRDAQGFHDAVKSCRRTGVWSCPSGECVRIASCDVEQDGDNVVLRLSPPPGETLSADGIDECVRYVIGKPAGGSGG